MTTSVGPQRPAVEVADVIREYGEKVLARYGGTLTGGQRRTLRDLAACRTAALGGHLQRCGDCGHEAPAYNSCRNRHCPKCQAASRAEWLDREARYLLPVEYHHVVFTLPQEVAAVALARPALLYDLLFRAAAATLRDVAANPKRLGGPARRADGAAHLGAEPAPSSACALCRDGGRLVVQRSGNRRGNAPLAVVPARLFPAGARPQSRVPGKYLALLRQAFAQGRLSGWADAAAFTRWLTPLYAKEWLVYAKAPFGGPERVLKYLARYTHRVAISNHRLVSLAEGRVTFRYKDYADDQQQKTMTLPAEEFLRRFVQHVLPQGFVKVRHYGLLANRYRAERLRASRQLLLVVTVAAILAGTTSPSTEAIEPVRVRCCPKCGSRRLVTITVPKGGAVPATPNTS